jgi:sarcosine oxidase subunit delta
MLVICCPYCGPRPEPEFRYGGEAHIIRPLQPETYNDQAWAEFLYYRSNTKGPHAERWMHLYGCTRWFNALRDTMSDQFLATYQAGQPRPDLAPSSAGSPA